VRNPTAIAVTPVNFEEIIEKSKSIPFQENYTEKKLQEIRKMAQSRGAVAYVYFSDDFMWYEEELIGRAVHDLGDWRDR